MALVWSNAPELAPGIFALGGVSIPLCCTDRSAIGMESYVAGIGFKKARASTTRVPRVQPGRLEADAQRRVGAASRCPQESVVMPVIEEVVHVDLDIGVVLVRLELVPGENVHGPARRRVQDDG